MTTEIESINRLEKFDPDLLLVGALLAQIDFLTNRPPMLEQDLKDPQSVIHALEHEVMESLGPARKVRAFHPRPTKSDVEDLRSEAADVVVFGLSAIIASKSWSPENREFIEEGLFLASDHAALGDFDLNLATIDKITNINSKHYPVELFREGMPYSISRRFCRMMRKQHGSDFWTEIGGDQMLVLLDQMISSDDEDVSKMASALVPFFPS